MKIKKYNMLGIAFLGMLFLMSASTLVFASDDDGDGVDDDFEDSNKRDIEIEFNANEFQVESKLRSGGQFDEIKLKVQYEAEGLSIEIGFESSDNTTELEIEFEVTFRKLIEFVDMNTDGIYNPLVDDTIQEVLLNSFQPVVYTTSIINSDTDLHYFIVNTTDGLFTAHIYLVEEFDIVNGTFIKPTQTKIDIEITDFNYINGSSQLALYTKLESELEYGEDEETENEEEGHSTDENSVKVSTNDYAGFFSWADNASIDGVSKLVLGSPIQTDDDDENEQKMYLNYPRGDHIYHDPVMGIMVLTGAGLDIPLIIFVSVLSFLGIGSIILFVVLKRRRNIE